jgi:hypothetical protein
MTCVVRLHASLNLTDTQGAMPSTAQQKELVPWQLHCNVSPRLTTMEVSMFVYVVMLHDAFQDHFLDVFSTYYAAAEYCNERTWDRGDESYSIKEVRVRS